ncbi:patatin-like phospholipase family protein [Streptomyces sp. NBC_01462]|uniref:patatin-like phospholipase family protein n=1 Tax=Streptomyces sp. NBC_01462 TaxID=2903876 RepID=UPI002E34F0F2|nr:patatin-like phospholipase family protein [Streptomyces sp. NBC_01462]
MSTLRTGSSAIAPFQVPREDGVLPVPSTAGSASPDIVAFVLQGGGSLCASQVGALRALTQAGITPDLVVGSSAGALNGVAFAADPSIEGIERLEALWLSIKRRHVAPFSLRTLVMAVVGRGEAAVSSTGLRQLLRFGVGVGRLEDVVVPAHVVATDFETGAAVVLSRGNAVSALLASAAFPGLYPPVRVGERLLIDGGVSADTPVLQAEALGATTIYVLPAAVTKETDRHAHAVLLAAYRAVGQILDERERRDVAAVRGTVVRLPAADTPVGSLIDFRDTRRLVQAGYSLTQDWLAQQPVVMT